MKKSHLYFLSLALIIMVLGAVGCKKRDTGEDREPAKMLRASAFTLSNYDGASISLSDYAGKTVVLEWVNYECPFSNRVHKEKILNDLAQKYKEQGVVFLGINSTAAGEAAGNRAFAEKYEIGYPILMDASGEVGRKYDARTTPHMYVINEGGEIVYMGALDNDPQGDREGEDEINYVDKALGELIAGERISIPVTKPYGCSVKYGN